MTKKEDHNPRSANQSPHGQPASDGKSESGFSRRDFLKTVTTTGAVAASGSIGVAGGALLVPAEAGASEPQPLNANQRRLDAYLLRRSTAFKHFHDPLAPQNNNGDEGLYPDRRANFSKGLPHNSLGEVDPAAYGQLLKALGTGRPSDFEAVPMGGTARLANPQAAYAFDMFGVDPHATSMPPPPAFASAEAAAEIGEIYWMALARDVPFQDYRSDPLIDAAVDDLNAFSVIVAPKENGRITPDTLFRGETPGDLAGPYISQLLWFDVPYGAGTIVQRYRSPSPDWNFMTGFDDWLAIQRGAAPTAPLALDDTPRYIHTMRSLAGYVHEDHLFQAFFNAALIISGFGRQALDPANPYLQSRNQGGFITFGPVHSCDLVTKAARIALEAGWYHKWLVHRRMRPEVFGGRIENQIKGSKNYGIHVDILKSDAVQRVLSRYGTALLPQAYPEGSPLHPSYPAGHAVIAGACAAVLKAFFNEDYVIPEPVVPSPDAAGLETWTGAPLTLGGEINKLASNISVGRCAAGIHYRFDGRGFQVGEALAIGILQDYSQTYNEPFDGFTLTKFDGRKIRIVDGNVLPV